MKKTKLGTPIEMKYRHLNQTTNKATTETNIKATKHHTDKATTHRGIKQKEFKETNVEDRRRMDRQFSETGRCNSQPVRSAPMFQQTSPQLQPQNLIPALPVVSSPQLLTIPSFSGFVYMVPVFQYWHPITSLNLIPIR